MISYVANIIDLFALTLQKFILISSFIGKLIVFLIFGISSAIFNIVESVVSFLQIVYEDNLSIFTEELPSFSNYVIDTFTGQWTSIHDGLFFVYNNVHCRIAAAISSVGSLIGAVFIAVNEVCLLLKSTIILLGDTLWFILTFIPVHLPLLLKAVSLYVKDIIIDIVINTYMSLLKITNFLTDVPLQSFIGIVSAIVIIRLTVHFQDYIHSQVLAIYWSCKNRALYLYHALRNWVNADSDLREITEAINETGGVADAVDSLPAYDGSDALCVICSERQKCVLTLPCRHVCLCAECCRRLYRYQRSCPICRQYIFHSVTVYL